MLTMENVTALRMRRHCLTRRAGAAEYDALYRDLSPGLNVHWHGFGQPPCLVERADFDDVEYNGRRQRQRILVKGRFQNGNIGFVEAAQMELFAGLYRRPYKPTEHSDRAGRPAEHRSDETDDGPAGEADHARAAPAAGSLSCV